MAVAPSLPATAVPPTARPSLLRRSRGSAALAAAVALGGLLWSTLLWAPTTVDLSAGATSIAGEATVTTVPEYGVRGTHVVDYRHGAVLEVTVPLRNDGPLPVTVTSAAAGDGVLPLLELRWASGLPLRLAPGEQADLVVRGALGNCAYYHEREVQNVAALVLVVEVGLGPATRSVDHAVALDRPLLVRSPMIVGCPDRTVFRERHNRRDAL